GWFDARVHVCGRSTDCGESVERGRCCNGRANGNVLQGNANGRKKACRCTANRTGSHVADKPMVITVLLGCLYAAGRMEVSEVGSDAVWIRRRRSLISAQGWSAATTLGTRITRRSTLKGLGGRRTPFRVYRLFYVIPGLSLRSNPGLKLANAFGVFQTALLSVR